MLLDSNIIIYAAEPAQVALRQFIKDNNPAASLVSYVETLGFHRLDLEDKQFLEEFFAATEILPITAEIAERAVLLRQQRRMSLGDALIAGTALSYGLTLITHDTDDFAWIPNLNLHDPMV
ncbi:type II toxin-antitoxin system VapC family toxin [Oscillatoria sp. CS-180]|uniref:type II toxin-antitoxin system VapC family toxin n=1 Tax=Oscillatoria sp. CS-180 TaxID=3021720 RepID=UPI00232D65F3|nr:type II toxin-antitoxin system VapC family toxin [Oscillatoria sp. CS-180]MDB9525211.1 type II toxin-antitoxin system VapC family toxin [Oscillatoria sp. CS-180]